MTDSTLTETIRQRLGASWCLFLDRDGVINTRVVDGYVRGWTEFVFEAGALDALSTLAAWAPQIVVVTNQQGVAKGLMSMSDLTRIHEQMLTAVAIAGGRIDAVLSCPHLATEDCLCRKPKPGMAVSYLDQHPRIDGSLSIMVGDTASDIEMGSRLRTITGGCVTIRIGGSMDPLADMTYPSLAALATEVRALLSKTPLHPSE